MYDMKEKLAEINPPKLIIIVQYTEISTPDAPVHGVEWKGSYE